MALSLIDFTNQTQSPLKRGVVSEITNESVFLRRLHFVPVNGFAYTYNRQKTLGGIAFRGLNESYTNDTGIVNPQVETLSIFGGEVRTDRQLVNKQGEGVAMDIVLGIIGAVVGGFIANAVGFTGITGFDLYSILVSVVGAVIVLVVYHAMTRRSSV